MKYFGTKCCGVHHGVKILNKKIALYGKTFKKETVISIISHGIMVRVSHCQYSQKLTHYLTKVHIFSHSFQHIDNKYFLYGLKK